MDADVLLAVGVSAAAGLETAFKAAGHQTQLKRGDDSDPIPGLLQVRDRFGNRVDLLLGLRGIDPQAFARVISVPFRGTSLNFIGREDFIAMKAFAGGPIDLDDAARAIAAAGSALDRGLVRRLARRYGNEASAILDQLLSP